jgi:small subunit ribosomal protein S1
MITEEITTPTSETKSPVTASGKNPYAFNWETAGKSGDIYSAEERKNMEQLYDRTLSSVVEHDIVDGTVVSIGPKDVLINIGFKSDGLVPLSEFRHFPDLKAGDKVEVYIETQEDKLGQLVLSHKKARAMKSWERVNTALDTQEVIQGFVKCRTKGGLIVDVFGIEAFLPGSQIDVKPIRDYDQFVNKTMEFKVVKINNEFKNVVVSHKILIEEELEQQKAEIMKKLEKGQVLEGTVKNITSYGVFMDLGGVDGLLHITDISWGRVAHPEEVVKLDQKLQVVILDFDDEKKRIALGLKQLTPHPWTQLDENLKVGDKLKGKVVLIADYGAFVEVLPGVEGLIHVSEMSWSQHLRSPHDFLKVGDEVEAMILTLDREERKMSLGLKQLKPDPWANVAEKYPVGSRHTTTVKNFQPFGVFVELEEGIDGLVHISDLSWTKKIKHPNEFCKVGDKMEVVVLEVDAENRRLSLGHKQLEDNPWDVFESIFAIGSVHEGTVLKMADKGAIIALPYGIEGYAPGKHLLKEDGKTSLKADEKADFKILEFNKDQKRILVSHRAIHDEKAHEAKAAEGAAKDRDREDTAKTVKRIKESSERTTLGDLSALSDLKNEMEATAAKKSRKKEDEASAAEEKTEE